MSWVIRSHVRSLPKTANKFSLPSGKLNFWASFGQARAAIIVVVFDRACARVSNDCAANHFMRPIVLPPIRQHVCWRMQLTVRWCWFAVFVMFVV